MDKLNRYFFTNVIESFASLFGTLFLIMSIVFFITIAKVTAYIEINFWELIKLYLFMLPRVLLFVLPISFFISLALALFRLSKENETIVAFTLGKAPAVFSRFFLVVSFLLSLILLIDALIMVPIASNLNSNFIDYKKNEAAINLKVSEFGQKFSNWYIYISDVDESKKNKIYKDIVMYSPAKANEDERIIFSKSGRFIIYPTHMEFELDSGYGYIIDKKGTWNFVTFDRMLISTFSDKKAKKLATIKDFWDEAKTKSKRKKDLSIYTLVALLPLASVFYAVSFGIVVYRYEKAFIYLKISLFLLAYFGLMVAFATKPLIIIPLLFSLTFISSIIYYKVTVARRF